MMIEQMEIRRRIKQFLIEHVVRTGAKELADDDGLLGTKAMDSLGLLRLVTFLESEFSLVLDDEDITPEHFSTVAQVARLVDKKLNQGNSAWKAESR